MNVRQIVELLGGTCKLARYIGIKSQAVSIWIRKNSIPLIRVPTLTKLSRQKGLPLRPEDIRPDVDWDALRDKESDIKFKER